MLNRNGPGFAKFFHELFDSMRGGATMLDAWVKLAPQMPGGIEGQPETVFLAGGRRPGLPAEAEVKRGPVARMSGAICGTGIAIGKGCPGYRSAHPGYILASFAGLQDLPALWRAIGGAKIGDCLEARAAGCAAIFQAAIIGECRGSACHLATRLRPFRSHRAGRIRRRGGGSAGSKRRDRLARPRSSHRRPTSTSLSPPAARPSRRW